jgi:hypothetical protein
MARFSAIPAVPQSGLTPAEYSTLTALKENVELLTGTRNEVGAASRALTKGQVTVAEAATLRMQQVTADGVGFTVSNVTVASLEDYVKLLSDVQQLANDVASIRTTLNTLIQQLKA